jgi:hypothetical protein
MPAYTTEPADAFAAARQRFEELIADLESSGTAKLTHAELETLVSTKGRDVLRLLFQGHLELRALRQNPQQKVVGRDGIERTHRRSHTRRLMTIFGPVTVERIGYGAPGVESLHPLDQELNLPQELYSHGLRYAVVQEAARGSFDEAVAAVERSTASLVPKRQVEQLTQRAAADFDAFYKRKQTQAAQPTTDPLILSLDSKGIVMRPEDLREATQKAAKAEQHKLRRRLSPGEKRNRKRMATVAAVYDVEPVKRTPLDIVASDLRPVRPMQSKPPQARNKRVWASVDKSPEEVTQEVFQEAQLRDPEHQREWVGLVDGDLHQIERVRSQARDVGVSVTLVLDFIHVLEYLWAAAWCFFAPGDAAADLWVEERALLILEGLSSDVAAGMRRSATMRQLAQDQRKAVDACADYLLGHKDMLQYHRYLAKGWPIATGVIEGACRHLVKDRMDLTGARWSLEGAEAVLRLRSLRSSGQLEQYWSFHLARERERNHLSRYPEEPLAAAA